MINHSKIKQEKNNTYTIDFIKSINGKRIHISKKGYASIEEAEADIPILLTKRVNEKTLVKDSKLFKDFFPLYLQHRSHKISPSTLSSIKSMYRNLFSVYDDMSVRDVFAVHNIIALHREIISREGVTEKWKNHRIGELRHMVDYASLLKLVTPVDASDDKAILENVKVSSKAKEKLIYTPHQLNKFLSVIDDENDRDLFILFSYLGARISEFVALRWDCFDERNKTIEIKRQILYLGEGKAVLTNKLKTRESYRKCKLSENVYNMLLKRRNLSGQGFIFPKSFASPEESLSKTKMRMLIHKYAKKAKLPIITPHGFRHSKATHFMSVCKTMAEVKAAAKFLGHSVSMMMETYAHSDERTIDLLIKKMED